VIDPFLATAIPILIKRHRAFIKSVLAEEKREQEEGESKSKRRATCNHRHREEGRRRVWLTMVVASQDRKRMALNSIFLHHSLYHYHSTLGWVTERRWGREKPIHRHLHHLQDRIHEKAAASLVPENSSSKIPLSIEASMSSGASVTP
jgi:hypothetical protein